VKKMLDSPSAFSWDERYSVNIAALDAQHQGVLETISELNEALAAGQGATAMESVLRKLNEYAKTHFAAEESLMELHKFPGLEAHRAEHEAFVQKLAKYMEDFRASKAGTPVALLFFLHSWLKDHILKTDHAYSIFLNERGVN